MQIVQLAYYVPNIEQAAEQWIATYGAGPFFISHHIVLQNVVFDGEQSALDHSSAYGWWGRVMVELVQQNCGNPSVFSDRPYGLHHAAYFAADIDEELDRLHMSGCPTRMTASAGEVRFAFADANDTLGHFLEVYHDGPRIRDFYDMVEVAADNWDGRDPIRS